MKSLADQACVRATAGTAPLAGEPLAALLARLGNDWIVPDGTRLEKTFSFPDFATALAFVNRVGVIADAEDHHPDIHLAWGKVRIEIWTHTVGGLTESDFVFAAKAERALAA